MYKYLIIFEKTKTGFSAYSPDVPGCIATGKTKKSTENQMKEAIEFHIEGLIEEGIEIPKPLVSAIDFFNFRFGKKSNKHNRHYTRLQRRNNSILRRKEVVV